MKPRHSRSDKSPQTELKGVVKKMSGELTSNPKLEEEGRAEMLGEKTDNRSKSPSKEQIGRNALNPDPHRRG